ncbi:hypothetical protein HYX02_01240 [Candidatus Woesearchaeota archaeon]|nr:hypothetical protein [Candidatus Woesearchaeota archaeon]
MKKINPNAIFIVAILILTLFFLSKVILSGNSILENIHYINDLAFVSVNTKETLKNWQLPLWTPYFYAGQPLLGIPESYMFDLNFLFIFLFRNIYLAMNLSLIIYFFLAGFGMYLLVKNVVDNKKAAFISAIIYMFNGFMHSFVISGHMNILEGYALIPFIFLFVHKALKTKDWLLYSILAGIFFALQIVSGSMILFFYTVLLVSLYFAFNLATKNFTNALLKSIFVGAVILIVGLSLSAIKLLPVLEFTKLSSRAVNVPFQEFLGYPVDFKDIARAAITNIGYAQVSAAVGIIGFILLLYGLFNYKNKVVWFSAALIAFSLLFATGTFVADLMYKIPGFDKLRHVERALVLFSFGSSILAAYGFVLLNERLKKYKVYAKYRNIFFAAIVALILLESLFLQKVPMASKIVHPDDIGLLAYMGKDASKFRTANLALKDIVGAAGYSYYAQKGISEVKGGGGIWVPEYTTYLAIAQQSLSSKMLGILNVKYIVADEKLDAPNIVLAGKFNSCMNCGVWEAFGPYLYENKDFLPRFYLVSKSALVVGDKNIAKQLIYTLVFQNWEPKNVVLVEAADINDYELDFLGRFDYIFLVGGSIDQDGINNLQRYATQGGIILPDILSNQLNIDISDLNVIFSKIKRDYAEISISHYSNNKVILDLNGERGWLALSERFAYFPGWKASINGRNVEIFKANNVISAVYLDGEKGELVFEYKPESYSTGKIVSLITLIVILVYFGYFAYIKSKS